ncbi:hypothetical protein GCM10010123_12380 [Pilimelia anulata]|uniref:Uncharacterized protein n=1 Tax=Pilimelia anulata TaxID=53371 RepID=A0A8J3F817_9ACTN|nr:hypothetical protein [Pilimelia anulata]GGJ84250.1 hypothetical protein GCM10010123_12380 [Pilimelia anulata]
MLVLPRHLLTGLADLANQRPTEFATWRWIAESMATELRRLAATAVEPPPLDWLPGRLHRHLRHARLPHGVTVDLHSNLVLDGAHTLPPPQAITRGWALLAAADLCRHPH